MCARVIVCDDDAEFCYFLADLLRRSGFAAEATLDAAAAMRLALSDEYDALISDLDMPGMTGDVLGNKLRALDETSDMLLIAISGRPVPDWPADMSAFDLRLQKPVRVHHLVNFIRAESTRQGRRPACYAAARDPGTNDDNTPGT